MLVFCFSQLLQKTFTDLERSVCRSFVLIQAQIVEVRQEVFVQVVGAGVAGAVPAVQMEIKSQL